MSERDPPFIVRREDFVKRVFTRIIAAIFCASFLAACAPESDSVSASDSVRVLTPVYDSKAGYSLGFMELSGINDITTLAGKFARFIFSPKVIDNKLRGEAPKTRFLKNSQGAYIPANEMTQQLVAIYGHIQNFAKLDKELGIAGLNKYPRDVGVAARLKGGGANNAFYDGKTDSMLFVPYTSEGLPIAVNGGILAHEHFHSIFYKMVINSHASQVHDRQDFLNVAAVDERAVGDRLGFPTNKNTDDLSESETHMFYHVALVRGMNEGLADFWGWMYTGDVDFIAHSLPSEKAVRTLETNGDLADLVLPNESQIKRSIRLSYSYGGKKYFSDLVNRSAYAIGTSFARFMKAYTDAYATSRKIESAQARKDVAKLVLKVLSQVKTSFDKLNTSYYTTLDFLKTLGSSVNNMTEGECKFLTKIMTNSSYKPIEDFNCKFDQVQSAWKIEAVKVTDEVAKSVQANEDAAHIFRE